MQYIAFDAHKHYTLASVATPDGRLVLRSGSSMTGERCARESLGSCERGSPVAVETVGNWYR